MECIFRRFADIALWGAADMPKDKTAIWRDLNRLENWDDGNLKKSCTWNGKTPSTQSGADWLQSSFPIRDLGVLVDTKANVDQQCALVVKKTNCMMFCISKSIVS